MSFRLNRYGGFTLIELLVVISIIGMLASVIVAGVSGARTRAIAAKATEEMHSFQLALQLYAAANGDMYPYDANGPPGTQTVCGDSPFPPFPYGSCDASLPMLISGSFISKIPHSLNSTASLGYTTMRSFGGATYYCGGKPINHYMIFLGVWNPPGLGLPWAEVSQDGGLTFTDMMSGTPHAPNSGSYCLAE